MAEPVEGGGAEQSVVEGVAPLGEVEVGGDYVESRVKLPDCDLPSGDPFSTRSESDLRASVGPPSAG